jgi:hypothetical protein
VAGGCREEDSQVRRESPVLIPDAMDSHMHLDRSLRRLRMDPRMGIQELLARRPRPAPKQEINVVGVCWSTVTLRRGLKTQRG